jgi:transposase-like protein
MDAVSQKTISHVYHKREGYKSTYPLFSDLKRQGLSPLYITMDGERSVMRAIKDVWPSVKIQRCLYHIQREGMRWLRTYPKTQAGRELRILLKTLCRIDTAREMEIFVTLYSIWLEKHRNFVLSLPTAQVAYKDLKKTMSLLNNAMPDMFHFLLDKKIHKTTNLLEGFYSRLKADYRKHRGLTEKHKLSYLNWYCYFQNYKKTNTL